MYKRIKKIGLRNKTHATKLPSINVAFGAFGKSLALQLLHLTHQTIQILTPG